MPRDQPAQLLKHQPRILEDVAVGVAAKLVAAGARLALTAAVLLPGVARVVVAVAVQLDRQPPLGPAAVHPPPTGGAVGLRKCEAGLPHQLQEPLLELAQDDARLAAQDPAQLGRARAVRPPREDGLDLGRRGAVEDAGLVAGARELVRRQYGGEVDERAGHGGDRHAAELGRVAVVAPPRSLRSDAGNAPLGGGEDLRDARLTLDEGK